MGVQRSFISAQSMAPKILEGFDQPSSVITTLAPGESIPPATIANPTSSQQLDQGSQAFIDSSMRNVGVATLQLPGGVASAVAQRVRVWSAKVANTANVLTLMLTFRQEMEDIDSSLKNDTRKLCSFSDYAKWLCEPAGPETKHGLSWTDGHGVPMCRAMYLRVCLIQTFAALAETTTGEAAKTKGKNLTCLVTRIMIWSLLPGVAVWKHVSSKAHSSSIALECLLEFDPHSRSLAFSPSAPNRHLRDVRVRPSAHLPAFQPVGPVECRWRDRRLPHCQ